MKLAIISDIHGNLEALDAVLADIDNLGADEIISLGDNIGYGPDSEAVIGVIRERGIYSILGNHELAVKDKDRMSWFNPVARKALKTTISRLSQEAIAYIHTLPSFLISHGCRFIHGFPPEFISKYLFQVSDEDLVKAFDQFDEAMCFIGHTHELRLIEFDGKDFGYTILKEGPIGLSSDLRYIINAGSVGQPRDDDNRAKYVLLDLRSLNLQVRCIPYDIASVVRKIRAAGLPEIYAERLM